ncbi:hypothetical protein GQ457_08G024550 [Hibiscus cannabinus]
MVECKRHINMNSEKINYKEKVEVVHEEKIRNYCYCDHKLDVIMHSVQNIEKTVVNMSAQFEKISAILTQNNVKGSIQDNDSLQEEGIHTESFKERGLGSKSHGEGLDGDSVNEKGIHSRSLKDDALHNRSEEIDLRNDPLEVDGLENKPHKKEGLSTTSLKEEIDIHIRKPCWSPFMSSYNDYASPALQPIGKRKFEGNYEDNIKAGTCGPKKFPSEIIDFQFGHHQFPSQLVTLKEIPMITKLAPKMSNSHKVSSKSKNSQRKKSVRNSTAHSNFTDDPKTENKTSEKRVRTYKVKVEKENNLCNFEIEQGVAQIQVKSETKDKYETCDVSQKFKSNLKQYLEYLTLEEHTICQNVATWKNTSNIFYIANKKILEVIDAHTVFPGEW